jgi:diguanylate cyclase (GGDEF)-like protein/PAS domain S-box-containing protein
MRRKHRAGQRRSRAAAALRESEARLRAVLALSFAWYWEQDAEHRFTLVEGGGTDRGALRLEQVLGKRAWELGLQDVSEAQMRAHREALERREPFSDFVFRIDGPDGKPRWSSVSGEPVFGPDGRFLGYRGTGRNVTAQQVAEKRLKKKARELEAIFANASIGIAFTREDAIVRCSPALHEIFGYAPGELVGGPAIAVWPSEEDYAALAREAGPPLLAGRRYEAEHLAKRKDGSLFWAHVMAQAVKAGDPSKGTIWIFEDVSEKKRAEERLFAEKERAQATLQAIGDAVIVTDVHGQIEFMNPIAETLTGCDLLSCAGQPVARVLRLADEATAAPVEDPVRKVLAGGGLVAAAASVILARQDGARHSVEYSAAPIRNREQEIDGVVIAFRDVTRQREMAEQVSWQASHDALTGLINRREFERRVEQALADVRRHGGQHALLFLDLDQFKIVNDTCGHAAGDELLRQLSHALAGRIRQTDTLARLGGDEFGVLLANCPIEQAHRVAEALRLAIEDFHFTWQDKIFKVGVSIGGVPISDPSKTLASLMSAADSACYFAKDTGRNRVHLVTGEDGELAERHGQMEWVSRIHRALEEDRFRLWFQEIRPTGARAPGGDHYELLIRMVDEHGKPVPPMAFIPAAERYDLMPAIDRWVVRTALAFFERTYGGGGRGLECASLNLSGSSINDPNFLAFVKSEFALRRVDPHSVCFEITETAAISNLARAVQFISELKAMGCRFSLDDFGSGMSSFAYLKNLPVDFLKIDGSFVKDMHRDPIDRAMVEAIHRIGNVMGIATVAEFVESEEILACLRSIGVDYAQGYGIARPQPLEELARAQALLAA